MVTPYRALPQRQLIRKLLYRKGLVAVILGTTVGLAALWLGVGGLSAQELTQHYGRKPADSGPRAVGLVQLSSTGKARLIPIVILMNGKFFDASSYKATPVPMALDFGVVYEAFKTGVSQGTFTITQPGQLNHNWIAEGTWLPAGVKPASENTRKYAAPVIEDDDSKSDRPVLHRRAGGKPDQDEQKPASPTEASPASPSSSGGTAGSTASSSSGSASTTSSGTSSPPAASSSTSGGASAGTQGAEAKKTSDANQSTTSTAPKADASSTATRTSGGDEPIGDPNRPRLRRGKPDPSARHELFVDFDAQEQASKKAGDTTGGASTTAKPSSEAAVSVVTVAAVSDVGGPDPRPYSYDLKPAEEAIYRKKMLELAATLVKPGPGASFAGQSSGKQGAAAGSKAASPATGKAASTHSIKPAKAQFEDVSLRIFDLSTSNEPVLVLSARTPLAATGASTSGTPGGHLPQEITLVARTDLEGEVRKLFFAQTDSRHLEVSPRMELIDAVDADGDGRGELLFRRTWEAGSAYAIYRVAADQLWPLWEGTP